MSVVQLKDRITNSPEEFTRFSSSTNSQIFTTAEHSAIENFSIEISLGEGWNDNYSDADVGLRKIDKFIIVPRGGSIVVEIAEEIRVPFNKYGLVLPTGSLFLAQGILIASAKVEPAFCGRLKLRLFNTTAKKVTLVKGRKLGSVIFFSTESTMPHDMISRNSSISIPSITRLERLGKWFGANKPTWIGWLIAIGSPWLLATAMYFVYYKPSLENAQNKASAPAKAGSANNVLPPK
jgi:deoxycytidine triphosphate deaminase